MGEGAYSESTEVGEEGGGGGGAFTLRAQSMVRKVWAITKLNSKLLKEATARPAERVSRGWISEGYNQARGPYDQA